MRYISIIFLLVNSIVYAEKISYELIDIRNAQKYTLIVEEDLVNEEMRLYVSYRHKIIDSLLVPSMRQIERVSEFQENFLKVEFRRGGGSNLKVRHTSVFCVADAKIVTSLSQISKIHFHVAETYVPKYDSIKGTKELEDYSTSIKLRKLKREFAANINESFLYKSIFDPENNDKWLNYAELKFNNDKCIFYSGKREVKGHFQIYYLNKSEETKELNGEFWAVELKRFTYLLINAKWFYIDGNKLNEI